ncbi:Fe-S-cluster containining protein [Pseudomonas sp. BIGb0381]|uniref:YkgJ family cysteine cluster protein n=1 Tax=Pseudomonas sp. BIGb0381 TaxID=2940608 RepID=UPI002169EC05|nr:YkgJ family cysteine cluster protein [Pseudomonas sp. BIGb0381]MCS4314185.1 Fe-S-cluster containining protein [Pseudomonas sp. BIGb0381]
MTPISQSVTPIKNHVTRFTCNGCGICCKGRLIPLTLQEAEQWLNRGGNVAVILEAFDTSAFPLPEHYNHSVQRAVDVASGEARIQVIAIFAGNALTQCPSLGEDNRCTIYEDRPLVCRIYPMEINPFLTLRPEEKVCPPEVWESGEVLWSDRVVDPVLEDQIQRSRQADRDDAKAKVSVCAALGMSVAAWKGNALAVYLADRAQLQQAISLVRAGGDVPANVSWKVRVDDADLHTRLQGAGVELDLRAQTEYIFHSL